MRLLRNISTNTLITGRSVEVDLLDDKAKSITCSRCGFVNNHNSTVCKECNSLLKDDIVIHQDTQPHYY